MIYQMHSFYYYFYKMLFLFDFGCNFLVCTTHLIKIKNFTFDLKQIEP